MHGLADTAEVHAADLKLTKFIDATTLNAATTLPGPSAEVRTVLLTGATGFLGALPDVGLAEAGLDRFDGMLICLVGAKNDDKDARQCLEKTFNNGDPQLWRHFPELDRQSSWRPAFAATKAKRTWAWTKRPGSGLPTPSI